MKKQLFTLNLLFFAACSFLHAQITETDRSMSQGINTAFMLEIPNADEKVVEKTWKKYAKDFKGKAKKDKKSDEWFHDDAEIAGIGGSNTLDIYTKINQSGENVTFISWFDLGGAYLNSTDHPDKVPSAEKILMAFGLEVAKEMTILELEEEEKKLKGLNSSLKKLEKDKENYEKEIEQAKERIAKAEANIEQNAKDQDDAKIMIENQQKAIEKVKKKLNDLN